MLLFNINVPANHTTRPTEFSFEAGGRAFRPMVSNSMSGTLMPIFEGFVLFFIITSFF